MKDLKHTNNQKVKAALAQARERGDANWVKPLLEAYAGRPEDSIREEMRDLLSTMKISSSEHVFLDALVDNSFAHIKPDLLSLLWNCGFTCEGRLARVAEVAERGLDDGRWIG